MNRHERQRLARQEAAKRREQQERAQADRHNTLLVLWIGDLCAGIAGGLLVFFAMLVGALAVDLWLAAVLPAGIAAIYFTLLYEVDILLLRRTPETRERVVFYARRALAGALAATLITAGLLAIAL